MILAITMIIERSNGCSTDHVVHGCMHSRTEATTWTVATPQPQQTGICLDTKSPKKCVIRGKSQGDGRGLHLVLRETGDDISCSG